MQDSEIKVHRSIYIEWIQGIKAEGFHAVRTKARQSGRLTFSLSFLQTISPTFSPEFLHRREMRKYKRQRANTRGKMQCIWRQTFTNGSGQQSGSRWQAIWTRAIFTSRCTETENGSPVTDSGPETQDQDYGTDTYTATQSCAQWRGWEVYAPLTDSH